MSGWPVKVCYRPNDELRLFLMLLVAKFEWQAFRSEQHLIDSCRYDQHFDWQARLRVKTLSDVTRRESDQLGTRHLAWMLIVLTNCERGSVIWMALHSWRPDSSRPGSNPTSVKRFASELWQFRLPRFAMSFGWDTKSRWSLLSGVYARGSKRPHQSALACVTVVDSTSHSKLP